MKGISFDSYGSDFASPFVITLCVDAFRCVCTLYVYFFHGDKIASVWLVAFLMMRSHTIYIQFEICIYFCFRSSAIQCCPIFFLFDCNTLITNLRSIFMYFLFDTKLWNALGNFYAPSTKWKLNEIFQMSDRPSFSRSGLRIGCVWVCDLFKIFFFLVLVFVFFFNYFIFYFSVGWLCWSCFENADLKKSTRKLKLTIDTTHTHHKWFWDCFFFFFLALLALVLFYCCFSVETTQFFASVSRAKQHRCVEMMKNHLMLLIQNSRHDGPGKFTLFAFAHFIPNEKNEHLVRRFSLILSHSHLRTRRMFSNRIQTDITRRTHVHMHMLSPAYAHSRTHRRSQAVKRASTHIDVQAQHSTSRPFYSGMLRCVGALSMPPHTQSACVRVCRWTEKHRVLLPLSWLFCTSQEPRSLAVSAWCACAKWMDA